MAYAAFYKTQRFVKAACVLALTTSLTFHHPLHEKASFTRNKCAVFARSDSVRTCVLLFTPRTHERHL